MTPTLRERLKQARSEIERLEDERGGLVEARDQAKEKFEGSDVPIAELTQTDDFKAAEQAVKALGECDEQLHELKHAETQLLKLMGEDVPASSGTNGPSDVAGRASDWDVEGLLESEDYKSLVESGRLTSRSKLGSVRVGQLATREGAARFLSTGVKAANEVGSDEKQGAIPADRRGIVAPNLLQLGLLDLFPVGTTDSNIVEYTQVLTIPSSAAETAEGAVKPEQGFTTVDADAPVRTVAGWIKVRKQALADVAALGSLLNTLLPYDVRRRIAGQMLVGDGTDQNLLGILNTEGIGAPEFVEGDNTADAILRAITTVVLSDADPNFVGLHPLTKQDLMLMREDQENRSGAYLYGTPASPAAPTIWGLAMTANRLVPEDSPLVGDSMSASLLVREAVNVLVSDSDGDDFTRNRVTVLAEARVAFPIWRPSSFAVASLSADES